MSEALTTTNTSWDLAEYFYTDINDPRLDEAVEAFKTQIAALVEFEDKIDGFGTEGWTDVFERQVALSDVIHPPLIYLSLLKSLDTQNQDVTKRKAEIGAVVNQECQKILFVDEALRQLGYNGLVALAKRLPAYSKRLLDTAKSVRYMLEEPQERVLMEIGQVTSLFVTTYSELTNSFTFVVDGQELTTDELLALRRSADETQRKAAWDTYLAKYSEKSNQIVLGNIYKSVCKANVANMRNRGMETVMFSRNDSEDMEEAVVDMLLDQVATAYPLFQRFLKQKAKLMGKDVLDYWDLLAPLPGAANKVVPFQEGFKLYQEVMQKFDPEFHAYSQDMLDRGRIDVYPAKGKRSGAFAQYDKGIESVVLLNYTDTFNDVMTLAHELGHAIHGYYSQEQHRFNYGSPLCLAETASIFNEQILFDSFFPQLDASEKTYYTAERLTDIFSTMFRQVMYVRFERRCHESFQQNQQLGYEDFNRIWLEETTLLYGDAVRLTPELGVGWSSIPHIFQTPFYCYAYSFGMTLSFALYNLYQQSEDTSAFRLMYKDILRSGGSVPPRELLLQYGIDIAQPDFYGNAFALIETMIERLES